MKIYVLVILIFCTFCTNISKSQTKDIFEKFDQYIGVWVSKSSEYTLMEKWERITPSKFEGVGLKIVGTDTVITEVIEMLFYENSIFYNPRVLNENNGNVVSFKMSDEKDKL